MASAIGWNKSGRSDAIRPEPILDERADPALRVNAVGNHREDDQKDDREDLQQRGKDQKSHVQSERIAEELSERAHRSNARAQRSSPEPGPLIIADVSPVRASRTFSRAGSPGGPGDSSTIQHLHAEIADPAQGQAGEFRHRLAHLPKDIFDRVDAVLAAESAWIRSRRISQSSRAWPGPRTARLSRCRRPLPLIIEPRFSAKPNDGRTALAKRGRFVREQVHRR